MNERSVGWSVCHKRSESYTSMLLSEHFAFFSESVINTIMSHLAANKDFLRDAFKGKNYLETVMLTIV